MSAVGQAGARKSEPSYSTRDPRGWCGDPSRGAALGRRTTHDAPPDTRIKLYLRVVPLDSGGYDRNGTYFGDSPGTRIYWYADADGEVDAVVRASSRVEAKRLVRTSYPNARFFR